MPTAREGESTRGGLSSGGVGGIPRENFEYLALLCALCVWDQISVTYFVRKDISWRVRKPNAKQNRFHSHDFFIYFFLRHIS